MKLTKQNNISKPFQFEGVKNVLIVGGIGSIVLERKLGESDWWPVSTDISGNIAQFILNGECAYNGTLEEKGLGASYRFNADIESGEVEIILTAANR